MKFFKDVFNGNKKLFKKNEIIFCDKVPRWPEFYSVNLYEIAIKDPELMRYLPDLGVKRVPSRKYMLNIMNTINPG